jgi:hypothetical protein
VRSVGDLGIDGRMILRFLLGKSDLKACTGFTCLRIGRSGWLL